MKVKWLVETGVFDDTESDLIQTLKDHSIEFETTPYVPINGSKEYLKLFDDRDCVVFYGSLNFAAQIQREAPWVPGVYCDLKKYECTYYYPRMGNCLLNYSGCFLPYGMLRGNLFEHLTVLGSKVFLRPNRGDKGFNGQLVNAYDDDALSGLSFYNLDDSELCLIAPESELLREWRLIVTNEVITGSQYKTNMESDVSPELPQEVIDYGNKVLLETNFRPDPIWTLDICETKWGLNVLEIGSFSAAGMYASDLSKVVQEVNKLASQEWEDIYTI